ncbi:MAG: YHYH protein [Bacteroidota bacterium]
MKKLLLIAAFLTAQLAGAQMLTPEITSWVINTDGSTGYKGIPTNVQLVQYTATDVYVSATCIPGYDIGPWTGNPNQPANQNFCFKITRSPQMKTGTKTATPLGHIGVWKNGVSIFNAKDAFSYNNQKIWNQDALPNEGASFDECLGHPAPNGEYHHHVNPTCLYDDRDSSKHSPLIGYAFDGFPIYGAYAFKNADGTGAITRMRTSYRLRNISDRTTLADGTQLSLAQYGPAINAQNPLGKFIEDYEFLKDLGDLDEYNGRICKTPEYPDGIYAYFVTIDENHAPVFPYTVGLNYYGIVQAGNTGPQSGHNTSTGTTYSPTTSVYEGNGAFTNEFFPNPTSGKVSLLKEMDFTPEAIEVTNILGEKFSLEWNNAENSFDMSALPAGIYYVRMTNSNKKILTERIVKQ